MGGVGESPREKGDIHTHTHTHIIPYDITNMWNLKYDTNELIYKIETDSQTQKTNLWVLKERE